MGLHERLEPVLTVARESAARADADAAFPKASVTALRDSGLLGLTLSEEVGGLGRRGVLDKGIDCVVLNAGVLDYPNRISEM